MYSWTPKMLGKILKLCFGKIFTKNVGGLKIENS